MCVCVCVCVCVCRRVRVYVCEALGEDSLNPVRIHYIHDTGQSGSQRQRPPLCEINEVPRELYLFIGRPEGCVYVCLKQVY